MSIVRNLLIGICCVETFAIVAWIILMAKPVERHGVSMATSARKLAVDITNSPEMFNELKNTFSNEGSDALRLMVKALSENKTSELGNGTFWKMFQVLTNYSRTEEDWMVNDTNAQSALSFGAPLLLNMTMSAPGVKNQSNALRLLSIAARSDAGRLSLEPMGGKLVKALLGRALKYADSRDADRAVALLYDLSMNDGMKEHILAGGALKDLMKMVKFNRTQLVENAVWTLVSLTDNAWRQSEELIAVGAVGPLISLLDTTAYPERVVQGASSVLNNVCIGSEMRAKVLIRAGAISKFVSNFQSKTSSINTKKYSTLAMLSMTAYPPGISALMDDQIIPAIVEFLNDTVPDSQDKIDTMHYALQVAGNIAMSRVHTEDVAKNEMMKTLMKLINGTNAVVSQTAVWTMNNILVLSSRFISVAIRFGVIPAIIRSIPTQECGTIKPAVSLLHEIALDPKNRHHFDKIHHMKVVKEAAERCVDEVWVQWASELQQMLNPSQQNSNKNKK